MLRSKNSSSRARAASTSSRSSLLSRGRGRGATSSLSTTPNTNSSNPFEKERLENAAKREQKGQESAGVSSRGARGSGRGRHQNKTVRFTSPPIQPPREPSTVDSSKSVVANGMTSSFMNSETKDSTSNTAASPAQFNPFGPVSTNNRPSPFGTSASGTGWNPFSSASPINTLQANSTNVSQITNGTNQSSLFGASSGLNLNSSTQNLFNKPLTPSSAKTSIFGATNTLGLPLNAIPTKPVITNKDSAFRNASTVHVMGGSNPPRNSEIQSQNLAPQAGAWQASAATRDQVDMPKNNLGTEIGILLRKNGIVAPPWPTLTPGDPSQKATVEAFWQNTKAYRSRVRACLIQNGYLDDPEKPKKLSEAIDFKGTCEEMCPQFEKITRIVEHDVQNAEKELSPDGQTYWPAPYKMVKALARSAAGQDAPLPEDIRSPGALRRTLDYLIDTVLGTNDLPVIHGFLWDRTRAIRRDFVFQQSSISSQELLDQVYCLEQITRFHVVALHQMSHQDVIAEDFSEQQEVEQLGKALLSLIHAYEDGKAQGIQCENEPEFRAYYVLFNSHNTGILEAVQDWGWNYWSKSDDIRTAVILLETLQNIWDTQGPLNPHSATDVAQNTFHRFFSIIESAKVSYTMACFAEIHFNKVRKAALKTILSSYRKQRDQTTDWTLERLNAYLYFDDLKDIVAFGEAYGVHFDISNGQECLSFESEDSMKDPFPQLKQSHSYRLVEQKRGDHILPDVIHHTVFGEMTEQVAKDEDDSNSLFVAQASDSAVHEQVDVARSPDTYTYLDPPIDDSPLLAPDASKSSFQKEQPSAQVKKSEDHHEKQSVYPPTQETNAPSTISRGDNFSVFGGTVPNPDDSMLLRNASIFDNKTALPQQGIFSFLDQAKNSAQNQTFSHNTTHINPRATLTQTKEVSKTFIPPTSKPTFQFLERSGSLISSPPMPPSLTSTTSTAQSGRALDSANNGVHVHIEVVPVEKNIENAKQLLLDRPISNQPASPGSRDPIEGPSKNSRMASFTQWVTLGQDGLIDQFIESSVENILIRTIKSFVNDEKKRRLEEEERLSREEAANYRYKFLATKYFYAWRDSAYRLWMRRKGRLARQARRQMAEESFRASRESEKKDIVQEFRASGDAKQQDREQCLPPTEDKLPSHKVIKYAHRGLKKTDQVTNGESAGPLRQEQSTPDDALRKSLLSESAYLQGGSRIHLIPRYNPHVDGRRQPNGVMTDYFRLKARGIMTLPNGTPLANTAAVHLSHKRSLDEISRPITPERRIDKPVARSVPSKLAENNVPRGSNSVELSHDFDALKARARAVMAKDEERQNKKRFLDDDEMELFASAKRVREQMDEETLWMREQIQKSMSRSSS